MLLMNNFLPQRGSKNDEHIKPSKTAAAHTEENFRPPDTNDLGKVQGSHLQAPKHRKSFKEWLKSLTKKQWIIIGIVGGVLLIGGAVGAYFLLKDDKKPVVQEQKEEQKDEPVSTTVASNLSGLQVAPSVNDRPVTAVMIENSLDARPQAGLNQASVVFEAIAEGGITRFMALYQDTAPDYVGPVRSVRPYYVQWALGFDAAIAHAGGSADGLNMISSTGAKDLNHNSSYFWRVDNRAAPHNLYTSIPKLNEYEAQKGYGKAVFTSLARRPEAPSAAPTARKIDLNISTSNYNVQYIYDATNNVYLRSEGGKPQTDEKSGAQLAPKSVIAFVVPQGKNGVYTTYGVIGSGQVVIFQDGVVQEGTWKKDSNTANFTFTDASGNPIALIPGQAWLTALGSRDKITFTP